MWSFFKRKNETSDYDDEMVACCECGGKYYIEDLDEDGCCDSCASFLADCAWDAVDPDHNFSSFDDCNENGH